MRDPNGIRPCFYFQNDEIIAAASERVALMTIFNQKATDIKELDPGTALVVKRSGKIYSDRFIEKSQYPLFFRTNLFFTRQ